MQTLLRRSLLPLLCLLLSLSVARTGAARQGHARGWVENADDIAAFLKQAEVVAIEDIGTGVTSPKRARLAPGGPVDSFVWKAITPGRYSGYWESYKAEIAAYELDKLIGLHMVPVTVERQVAGRPGAAMMWLEPARSFGDLGGLPTPPSAYVGMWNLQLVRAKMFDNLIYNIDPNLGNWLVDPSWNVFLIDHSRAFTEGEALTHEITRVDPDLWNVMQALDEPTLTAALGQWLTETEIRAILRRRDLMATAIDALLEEREDADVYVRATEIPPVVEPGNPANADEDRAFGNRATSALETLPYLPPASALQWSGEVVLLADYQGTYADTARRGLDGGCTIGLVTRRRLICLAPDARDPGPYRRLLALVGQRVEIVGTATVGREFTTVAPSTSRPLP